MRKKAALGPGSNCFWVSSGSPSSGGSVELSEVPDAHRQQASDGRFPPHPVDADSPAPNLILNRQRAAASVYAVAERHNPTQIAQWPRVQVRRRGAVAELPVIVALAPAPDTRVLTEHAF